MLKEELTQVKSQLQEHKRETVQNLSTLVEEITRIEEVNIRLEDDILQQKSLYQQELEKKDKTIEALLDQLRERHLARVST